MKKLYTIFLVLTITNTVVYSQLNPIQKFLGSWEASGVTFGMPSQLVMKWETTLAGKYTRITYKMVMHPTKGDDQVFEGEALYKLLKENDYSATWFDSQGAMHPITATFIVSTPGYFSRHTGI